MANVAASSSAAELFLFLSNCISVPQVPPKMYMQEKLQCCLMLSILFCMSLLLVSVLMFISVSVVVIWAPLSHIFLIETVPAVPKLGHCKGIYNGINGVLYFNTFSVFFNCFYASTQRKACFLCLVISNFVSFIRWRIGMPQLRKLVNKLVTTPVLHQITSKIWYCTFTVNAFNRRKTFPFTMAKS